MSGAETQTMSTEQEEELPRSDSPDVRTALRDPQRQLRLLRLHGGSKRQGIFAPLEVWERESEPKYRAISYVCGDTQRMQSITVNGSRVSVRHNCYYALWQARLHYPKSCYLHQPAGSGGEDCSSHDDARHILSGASDPGMHRAV
jgi:hypothetical protein